MNNLPKITRAPRIVQPISRDGFETIYWIGSAVFIQHGSEKSISPHRINGAFYRKVEMEEQDTVRISISLDDHSIRDEFYKPLPIEDHWGGTI